MGAAQGKAVSDESQQFTIRISRQLLEELDGGAAVERPAPPATRSRERRAQRREADHGEAAPSTQAPEGDGQIDTDALVQQALAQSMRLGDALLKQEDEQMQRIASLAQQLLDAESNTPAPPLACTAERAACSACYEQNAAQPLSCKAQVEAFARCADNALKSLNA